MTQYKILDVKLSISQLNKSKSGMKNGAEVISNLSSSVVGDSNDENNFLHKLLFTNTQVLRRYKVFAKNSSGNMKLSKN